MSERESGREGSLEWEDFLSSSCVIIISTQSILLVEMSVNHFEREEGKEEERKEEEWMLDHSYVRPFLCQVVFSLSNEERNDSS